MPARPDLEPLLQFCDTPRQREYVAYAISNGVEACRASPYLIGHLDAVAYPIGLILIAWGWMT